MNNWLSNFYERKPEYRNLRVVKRTPDAIHFELERGLYEAHIFLDRRFERSAAGAWLPKSELTDAVRLARKLIRNPQAALYFAAALPFLTTLTLQPDATSGIDTELESVSPTLNFGVATTIDSIMTGGSDKRRGLFQFDLSSIVAGSQVSTATFTRHCRANEGAAQVNVHRTARSWTEGTKNGSGAADGATWNTYDGTNNWTLAGGDFDPTVAGNNNPASWVNGTFYDFIITSLVGGWVSGANANNGLLSKVATETGTNTGLAADSSDNATSGNRPKLVVVYIPPLAVAGNVAAAGGLAKQGQKSYSAALTSTSTLAKQDQKTVSGIITSAGAPIKQDQKGFSGTLASAGTLAKRISKAFSGVVGLAAALAMSINRFVDIVLRPRSNDTALQARSNDITLDDRTN